MKSHPIIKTLIILLIYFLYGCAPEIDRSDPKVVVKEYLEATVSGNCDLAMRYVHEPSYAKRKACEDGQIASLRIDELLYDEELSRFIVDVVGDVTFKNEDGSFKSGDFFGVPVKRVQGEWYVR